MSKEGCASRLWPFLGNLIKKKKGTSTTIKDKAGNDYKAINKPFLINGLSVDRSFVITTRIQIRQY